MSTSPSEESQLSLASSGSIVQEVSNAWTPEIDNTIQAYFTRVKKETGTSRNTFNAPVWKALGNELVTQGFKHFSNKELKERWDSLRPNRCAPATSTNRTNSDAPTENAPTSPAAPISTSSTGGDSERAHWTLEAESFLVEQLAAAKTQGLMSENNFKSKVYTSVAAELKKKNSNFKYKSKQVKSRWTRMKAEFKIVSTLHTLSGFGWDEVRKMVTATDEVWDGYIEGHPKVHPFRKNPFHHYDEIAALVGHSTATGGMAFSSENSMDFEPIDEDSNKDDSDKDLDSKVSSDEESEPKPVNKAKKRHAASASAPVTPAPKRVCHSGAQALASVSASLNTLTTGLTSGALFATPTTDSPEQKKRAFQRVCVEEGLSPYSLSKARRIFRGSGEIAREYLSFDAANDVQKEARNIWLMDELEWA